MLFADVVFFTLSDLVGISILPMIVVVVVIEGGILWLYNRQFAPWKECVFFSALMNSVSAGIGVFLPDKFCVAWFFSMFDLVEMKYDLFLEHRIVYLFSILAMFFSGWLLSILIEFLTLWPMRKIFGLSRIALPVLIGNTVSYVFLLCCYLFFVLS
jgi:hypothetical protein